MLITGEFQAEAIAGEPIVIGLVNNMPDTALLSTERQFHNLLSAASHNRAVRIRHFSLPEVARSEAARLQIIQRYEDVEELWTGTLDGLIVTGTEPRASELTDEPYWDTLTKLIDWSDNHTISTVWSCLAAHAAVLYLDGIRRRRLPKKLFGVFECVKVAEDRIVANASGRWSVPHSRFNDLPEDALISRGYELLSRSAEVGADSFVKKRGSLDVFFQGHPEYEPDTLLREYRRDVGRFLTGEASSYPEMPVNYFDDDALAAMTEFQRRALSDRKAGLLQSFPMPKIERNRSNSSCETTVSLYANWISYLADCKDNAANKSTRARPSPPA